MNPIDNCEHCGAKLKKYIYPILPVQVSALQKFYNTVLEKNENCVHLQVDMDGTDNELGRSERSNWTMLRFHGLVAKYRQDDGSQLRGYWLLTKRGAEFLKGELSIPRSVEVYRNKVVGHSEDVVNVNEVLGSIPYVHTKSDIQFEAPSDEEIATAIIKKKVKKSRKKVKNPCPDCGEPMKIKLEDIESISGSMKVHRSLVCLNCDKRDSVVNSLRNEGL